MNFLRLILAAPALALATVGASALEIKPYSAEALQAAQQAGQPVALHFHADWCPICRAQARSFQSFTADKSLTLTLLVADYDKERALKRQLKVRSQSTLIVYRGTRETARLAGDTDEAALRATLKSAL